MRVAFYARVSTGDQTTKNQLDVLHEWAKRAGHTVVGVYQDSISGTKGRERRPGLDNDGDCPLRKPLHDGRCP